MKKTEILYCTPNYSDLCRKCSLVTYQDCLTGAHGSSIQLKLLFSSLSMCFEQEFLF